MDRISNHIPDWKNFKFSPMGKYLGIHIGPVIGGLNWKAPMDKAMTRAAEIHAQKSPLPYACGLYSSRALSALGYVAQLIPPPESFKIAELRMGNKILRLATNSFDSVSLVSFSFRRSMIAFLST